MLDVTLLPILEDNYTYILQSGSEIAVLDPGDAEPIINYLEQHNLKPTMVLNTHHHWDHVNGNKQIKEKYNCPVIGPENERKKIKTLDTGLHPDDVFKFGDEEAIIIETSGHTMGHICFWFKNANILFSGDTLFSMSCGRLFEGSVADIYPAFEKFNAMPDETLIYCGHEYTQTNGNFCLTIEPENPNLQQRMNDVNIARKVNQPTIPTTIELEKKTNVFMRAKSAAEFKKYRDLRDKF